MHEHLLDHQRLARWFTCPWCRKCFNTFVEFQEHEKAHNGEYICSECLKVFDNYKELSTHAKTHSFNCPVCDQKTNSRDKLAYHMKVVHGQEISMFRCGVCAMTLGEETEYRAHFNEAHRLKIRCKICCVGFKLQEELDAHTAEKHPPAQEVVKKADLSDPARTVNPLDTIEGSTVKPVGISLVHCPACDVYFSNGELFKGHINTYHQQLLVTCKYCNCQVLSLEISHHIISAHFTCFGCLKSFASEESLQAHIMECEAPASQVSSVTVPVQPDNPAPAEEPEPAPAPEDEPVTEPTPQASGSDQPPAPGSKSGRSRRPHACKFCERRFEKIVSLHMHESQAHKNRIDPSLLNTPATCDICNREFASFVDLEQHNKDTHKVPAVPGPAPAPTRPTHHYYCPFSKCDYFSYTEEDVHRHQRARHWHDYVFRCNKYKFVSDNVDDLGMHHARVHLGPFGSYGESVIIPCSLCHFNAKGWSSFFIHIRTHSQNKYPCSECQWTFSSPHGLNRHSVGTHDTRHFGCGFCILDLINNDELCIHAPTHQITCYLCWELFMSEEAFDRHMVRKHPARQLTVQQTRTKEEERAWEEQQQIKAMRRLKREQQRDREEDRKRRLHGETSKSTPGPIPSTGSSSPRKKRRRSKKPDLADLPGDDDDDNSDEPPDDDKLHPDFEPEEEEEDDDDDDNGGNGD